MAGISELTNLPKPSLGRNSLENEALQKLSDEGDIVIHIAQFPGPTTMVPHGGDDITIYSAASLCALYSDAPKNQDVTALCRKGTSISHIRVKAALRDDIGCWSIQ